MVYSSFMDEKTAYINIWVTFVNIPFSNRDF